VSARIVIAGVIALAAAGAAADVGARPVAARPSLRLVSTAPMRLHGSGFRAHERVRVRLRAAGAPAMTRRVRATRRGAFTTVFAGAVVDRCSAFSVIAVGHSGRRARLYRPAPKCPPA
jgi:hypothetical protein